jgi:hypothetical protein
VAGRLRFRSGLFNGVLASAAMACAATAFLTAVGCSRTLTISQDMIINTAMHIDRRGEDRTGQPLEVNIVSVYPDDFKNPANERLLPENHITSDVWYADRPQIGDSPDMEGMDGRFRLPKDQIFLLTDATRYYGVKSGGMLKGAAIDGKKDLERSFKFKGPLHNKHSVIYVFPKFIDSRGQVLPVPPAVFAPPGAYTHVLSVKIGVDETRDFYGQYIDNTTTRKMHGSGN